MRVVPPGTRAQRVVRETRDRVYPVRRGVNRFVIKNGKVVKEKDPPNRPIGLDDPGGRGGEIVRETLACPECAASAPPAGLGAEIGDHLDRTDRARVGVGQVVGRDRALLVQPAASPSSMSMR